jgi:hypothetical protein
MQATNEGDRRTGGKLVRDTFKLPTKLTGGMTTAVPGKSLRAYEYVICRMKRVKKVKLILL